MVKYPIGRIHPKLGDFVLQIAKCKYSRGDDGRRYIQKTPVGYTPKAYPLACLPIPIEFEVPIADGMLRRQTSGCAIIFSPSDHPMETSTQRLQRGDLCISLQIEKIECLNSVVEIPSAAAMV